MRRTAFFLIFLLAPVLASVPLRAANDATWQASSPDGETLVEFMLEGRDLFPGYRVLHRGRVVLDFSPLGLTFQSAIARVRRFDRHFEVMNVEERSGDWTWSFPWGKASLIRDNYRELSIHLREIRPPGRYLDLIFRVYDDGVAFRYRLPEQPNLGRFAVTEEKTAFSFNADHRIFVQHPASFWTNFSQAYIDERLSAIRPDALVSLPLLAKVEDGPWLAIAEADLTDYAGLYLAADAKIPLRLRCRLAPNLRRPSVAVVGRTPFVTPWRVIMIADRLGGLLESNLLLNLNEPCALADTSWIKPGKAAWSWWSGNAAPGESFKAGMNTATMLHYVDFAADAGLEYVVIDAGWYNFVTGDITRPVKKVDLSAIIAHARRRGVGIFLWVDRIRCARWMEKAFPLYEQWGVAGVKVDYFLADDQNAVKFYHDVLREAAEHRLLVLFHGCWKPTGLRRTYPHLLTTEAVRGLEVDKWSDWCDPEHEVTLAFTRLLLGEMDFTPGGFNNVTRAEFKDRRRQPMVMGTRCRQLAMYVIYESPLQMVSDYPAAYRGEPAFEFIRRVPTVWDETRVLLAEVADLIVIARRRGEEWFLGGMTDWTPREIAVPLDFLGEGRYVAEIYADGEDADTRPKGVRISTEEVDRESVLRVRLAAGGGVAVRMTHRT